VRRRTTVCSDIFAGFDDSFVADDDCAMAADVGVDDPLVKDLLVFGIPKRNLPAGAATANDAASKPSGWRNKIKGMMGGVSPAAGSGKGRSEGRQTADTNVVSCFRRPIYFVCP
jgi:hypothetical protein